MKHPNKKVERKNRWRAHILNKLHGSSASKALIYYIKRWDFV